MFFNIISYKVKKCFEGFNSLLISSVLFFLAPAPPIIASELVSSPVNIDETFTTTDAALDRSEKLNTWFIIEFDFMLNPV